MTLFHKFAFFLFFILVSASLMVFTQPENTHAQDRDADGIPDTKEASLGGNQLHKDIFVECDYMQQDFNNDGDVADRGEHSHRLSDTSVVQPLIQIFANAPVINPGLACQGGPNNGRTCTSSSNCEGSSCSRTGITLHLEQNQSLTEQRFLDFTNRKGGLNFFDIKKSKFDFVNRAPYYHYCILAHDASEEMGSASGEAEIFGNDFKVTLGSWASETGKPVGTVKDQIGTFLHELGHNLGLEHGGGSLLAPRERVKNYKSNYRSVMNYFFQVTGIDGKFDFSPIKLPTLNENNLNEAVGIGGSSTRYFCQAGALFRSDPSGAINWNCVNPVNSPSVAENLNADRTFLAQQVRDTLEGHDDWSNLRLNFIPSPVYDTAGTGSKSGFTQHPSYLGAYKPAEVTASRGVDIEPEVTFPEGRCLEFFSVRETRTSQFIVFRTDPRSQTDENRNEIGDSCER